MRSFLVRSILPLVCALFVIVLFLRTESTDVSPASPTSSARQRPGSKPAAAQKTLFSFPFVTPRDSSPEAATIAKLRLRIADADRESSGFFLEELDRVLSDQALSVPVDGFRLPSGNGSSAMLATFPDAAKDASEEHERLVLILAASAFSGCSFDSDYRHRFDRLTVRYPWLVAYVLQQ